MKFPRSAHICKIIFLFTTGLSLCLPLAVHAAPGNHSDLSPAVIEYLEYLAKYRCTANSAEACLEETSYLATRSDGRKVNISGVFRWFDPDPEKAEFIEQPHFLLTYMRHLREAYRSDPMGYGEQLFNQIDFLVSFAVDRNGALVWENKYGIAQGMEQAEFAHFFASAAGVYRDHGDLRTAKGTMSYALRFLRAFNLPVGVQTGGVASEQFNCGAKLARLRPCFWYHSRGLGIDSPKIHTVLNQHLHAVRDLLDLYQAVYIAQDLVRPEFGSPQEVLDQIEDRAIAGLYQLAFSEGNTPDARNRPPNIRQFMHFREQIAIAPSEEYPDGNPLDYYWAYYDFDMEAGIGSFIAHKTTCHYHTHSLEVMASIVGILASQRSIFAATAEGWRLYEAVDALLAGKGEATGLRDSPNAIYQFYRSEGPAFKIRRQGCDYGETLPASAQAIYEELFTFRLFLPVVERRAQ